MEVIVLVAQSFDFALDLLVLNGKLPPLRTRELTHDVLRDNGALLERLRSRNSSLAVKNVGQTAIDVTVKDGLFVVAVLGQPLDFLALDCHGAFILFNAVAIENANFHNRTIGPGRHAH